MAQTFEEVAGSELDALYQGALFLAGGRTSRAEQLLVEAMTLAFREHLPESAPEESRRWLEARLARAFLRHFDDRPSQLPLATVESIPLEANAPDGLGSEVLYSAAAHLPPGSRVAIWLVLLRRWSYDEAAGVIDVDPSTMAGLLGHRDALLQALFSGRGSTQARAGVQ